MQHEEAKSEHSTTTLGLFMIFGRKFAIRQRKRHMDVAEELLRVFFARVLPIVELKSLVLAAAERLQVGGAGECGGIPIGTPGGVVFA